MLVIIIPCTGAICMGGVPPPILGHPKKYQNDGFCSLWGLETMKTTLKHWKIFPHANYELCSSRVALFRSNFVFLNIFLNLWVDYFVLFGQPEHHFAHINYMGGAPPINNINLLDYSQVFVLCVHFEFWDVFSFWRDTRHDMQQNTVLRHSSGRSRFIPVRVRIPRVFAPNFNFEWVFKFFVFLIFWCKSFCTVQKSFCTVVQNCF